MDARSWAGVHYLAELRQLRPPSCVKMGETAGLTSLKIFNDEAKMHDHVDEIMEHSEESFYIGRVGELIKNYHNWREKLPHVTPFYAVKCNDEMNVIRVLAALGCNFDCASQDEIFKVLSCGVSPDRIIFANPTKTRSHLVYAAENKVQLMTVDTEQELQKIEEYHPGAKILVRIRADAKEVTVQMGHKFGCAPDNAMTLIEKGVEMGLNVVGVAFHVGSGCKEPEAYPRAIGVCAGIFKAAKDKGIHLKMVDIGGGFPENDADAFKKMAELLRNAMEKHKAHFKNVKFISEPGRYFVGSAFVLYASVIGVRPTQDSTWYYVNHGVMGAFNCVFSEHIIRYPYAWFEEVGELEVLGHNTLLYSNAFAHPKKPRLASGEYNEGRPRSEELKPSVIWGPTDIEMDLLVKSMLLPQLEDGDWLAFPTMGAYTVCLDPVAWISFPKSKVYYHALESEWDYLKEANAKSKEHLRIATFV